MTVFSTKNPVPTSTITFSLSANVPGTYSELVRGTRIVFGAAGAGEEARPFFRLSRQSRNFDCATRNDWKDWVRVWRSVFREVFSWLSCGRERSVIFTARLCWLACGSLDGGDAWWGEVYFVVRRAVGMTL